MTLTTITLEDINDARRAIAETPLGFILDHLGGGAEITSPKPGFFVGPLNLDKLVEPIEVGKSWELQIEGIGSYPTSYYVCDTPEQFIERYGKLLEDDERIFAVFFTPIERQPGETGGWRWHKWGQYIGDQTPTTEYLDDEPVIEKIHVVSVHSVRY